MPDFGSFMGTETITVPVAYVVPSELSPVLERLSAHGVVVERLTGPQRRTLERFRIDSATVAEREYQGHRERTLFGRYEPVEDTLPVGTVLVPTGQPLGRLVVMLLEPRSDDGLAAWNVLDRVLDGATYYPIRRLPAR
jgi:hypothetical protein